MQTLHDEAVADLRNTFDRFAVGENAIDFGESFIGLQRIHVSAAEFGFGGEKTLAHEIVVIFERDLIFFSAIFLQFGVRFLDFVARGGFLLGEPVERVRRSQLLLGNVI